MSKPLTQIMGRTQVRDDDFYRHIQQLDAQKWGKLLPPQIPLAKLSKRVVDNFVTPPETPAPDCLTCGLCCAFHLVITRNQSVVTEPEMRWDLVTANAQGRELIVDSVIRRRADSSCVFLAGRLQESVSCSNYEQRPRVCREFEAGSDKCHALRRLYGLAQPLTPEQIDAAGHYLAQKTSSGPEKIAYAQITWEEDGAHCLITAIFADGETRRLHLFDPQQETWWQSEFVGLSILEAERLIAARCSKESS